MVKIPIFDQDIINTMKSLPRTPSDAGTVKVQLKRKKSMKNTHLEKFVSPQKLKDALNILNKYYQFDDFDEIWRRDDPDGYEMVFGEKANESDDGDDITEDEEDGENSNDEALDKL